jgi:DNA-binding MarR family transcriptional regulator
MPQDRVDQLLEQWEDERPDLDPSPLGIVSRILRLEKHVTRTAKEALSPYRLELWGFDVLAALRRQGAPFSLSPTELRRAVILTSGAMTNRIDRLEERGWVERHADPADRRALQVRLTEDGQRLIDQAIEARLADATRLVARLTPHEQETVAGLLRKLLLAMPTERVTPPAHLPGTGVAARDLAS